MGGNDKYFTVIYINKNKNYAYEEGMTWEEFITSDYNVEGWILIDVEPGEPKGVYSVDYGPMINEDGSYVYLTDIISNKNYYLG